MTSCHFLKTRKVIMATHFLETENVYLNRVYSIRLVIIFYFILRALLCRHKVVFNVLLAKGMYRAASVKSNAKFSCLLPTCRDTSSTESRIVLQLTFLLLSSGRHSKRNVLFGISKLPTSTLLYFYLSTSTSSTIKTTFSS